ncbi:hypothetical protein [Paenibacillus graminis]|nr:hypothetical protein [Paenibacillus graminis]
MQGNENHFAQHRTFRATLSPSQALHPVYRKLHPGQRKLHSGHPQPHV